MLTLKTYSLASITILITLFISCNPDEDDILGLDLIQDDQFIVEKYIFPNELEELTTNIFPEEDVSGFSPYNLLGSFNDFYFGQSDASFAMQVLLPSNNIEFEEDSKTEIKLELSIPYHGVYGDTLQPMTILVHELLETLSGIDTTEVLVSDSFQYDEPPLIQTSFSPIEIKDSIQWNEEIVSPRLIIDLSSSSLGQKLINASVENLTDNESFTEFFKGLFFQVETQENGSIVYFDTTSPDCILRMTYTKNDQTESIVDFPIGPTANRHNHFTHDYFNSEVFNYLQNEDTDTLIFLQSMGGVAAEIDLSFLLDSIYSDWVVSRAALNIPIYEDIDYNTFPQPSYLVLTEYDKTDSLNFAIEGVSGGIYNPDLHNYSFIITPHIQKIISKNHNTIFRLYVGGKNSNAERLIIDNYSENGMSLELHIIK